MSRMRLPPPLTIEETDALIIRMFGGSKMARDELISGNLKLVEQACNKYRFNKVISREDMFSIGCIGLTKAVDHIDPDMIESALAFMYRSIKNEILQAILKEMRHNPPCESLDAERYGPDGEKVPLSAFIPSQDKPVYQYMEEALIKTSLRKVVNSLSPARRTIVKLRYLDINAPHPWALVLDRAGVPRRTGFRENLRALRQCKKNAS